MKKNRFSKAAAFFIALFMAGTALIPQPAMAASSPAKVSGVKVTGVDYDTLKVAWSKASGATGYYVYRATSKNGSYKKVKTIGRQSETSWNDNGVGFNKTYYYKVRAYHQKVTTSTVKTSGKIGTVKVSDALNVRSNASKGASRIGSLSKGTTFDIISTKKDKSGLKWYKLLYKNKYGYVSSGYVKVSDNTQGIVKANGGLYVRSNAGSNSSALGKLSNGAKITILGTKSDTSGTTWYKLSYNGKTGYVSSRYIVRNQITRTTKSTLKQGAYSSVKSGAPHLNSTELYLKKAETSSISLSWGAVAGASGYEIYRASGQSGTYQLITTISSGAATAFTDTGLAASTSYSYKLRPYRIAGGKNIYAADTNVISATTATAAPVKPQTSTGSDVPAKISVYEKGSYVTKTLPTGKECVQFTIAGKTYTSYWQSAQNYKGYNEFIWKHGCASTTLTDLLSAYVPECGGWTPYETISIAEKETDEASFNSNYSKTMEKQMPISLYGISKVLGQYGISSEYRTSVDSGAESDILSHLKKGNPVVVVVRNINKVTGQTDTHWASTYHTMMLIGLEKNNRVIIADSANKGWYKGPSQRFKVLPLVDVLNYTWDCTDTPSGGLYWNGKDKCGGYLKIGTK